MPSSSLFALALSLLVSQVTASCIHGTSLHRRAEGAAPVEVSTFGYTGRIGPLNWANLAPENSACATAKVQSPINIDKTIPLASEAPVLNIPSVQNAEFENLGTTVEVIVNGTTTFKGKDFSLKQFHLHTPSEHRISEEYFPLELHMVHEAADGAIAVIALTFQLSESGATTELLTQATRNIKDIVTPGTRTETGPLNFDVIKAHVETQGVFEYTGSLTTPPCAEGLTFLVAQHPLPINVATFNSIKSVVKFNSRFTQNAPGDDNLIAIAVKGEPAPVGEAPAAGSPPAQAPPAEAAPPAGVAPPAEIAPPAGSAAPSGAETVATASVSVSSTVTSTHVVTVTSTL